VARGSIAKREGKDGAIYWRLRTRDTSDRVREVRLTWKDRAGQVITSRAAAEDRLRELVEDLQGPPPAYVGRHKRKARFVTVASGWLDAHPNRWARDRYETLLKRRILLEIGDTPVVEVTRERLQRYVREATVAPETLRKCLLVIRCVLDRAVEQRLIAFNPARGLKRPKVERPILHIWTPTQVRKFLTRVEDFRWRVFCEVLFYAGLRFGEAAALTPGDVQAKVLIVRHAWDAEHHVLKPPKSGRPRSVDLRSPLRQDLLRYVEQSATPHDGLLFPAPEGGGVGGGYVWNSWFTRHIWQPAIDAAKLPRIRVHDARHTFVAHLLEAGENPYYVQQQAGHASAAFTLDRYAHLIPSRGAHNGT
jgi:integrase